jgi:penicillin-binding protein 1C
VLVLDNASGRVLAWVGSSGELSSAAQVDGVLARRQAGHHVRTVAQGRHLAVFGDGLSAEDDELASGHGGAGR